MFLALFVICWWYVFLNGKSPLSVLAVRQDSWIVEIIRGVELLKLFKILINDGYIEAKVGNITMRRDCTLLKMEDMLNSDYFFRVNKSCIVNLMKIDSYKKEI